MTATVARSWIDDLERRLTGTIVPAPADPDAPPDHRWDTPGTLAKALNGKTVQTPALDLIDAELMRLASQPDLRLILTMPPQEGKSVRVAHDFPIWWLAKIDPDARIVVGSYGQSLANRNGRAIRNTVTGHPELGLQIAADNGSAAEWQVRGHVGGVFSVGIGGGLTGRACDLLVIDDPIKNQKEADSEVFRENVWDWWQAVAAARLGPGAPAVVILTRWHEDDLAGRLLAEPESAWRVLNIPAQADHDPAKGETDVLGRTPGEFMVSTRGRTLSQWELRKREAGSRKWLAQYQGRPSAIEGGILKRDWWRRYEQPLWIERDDGTRYVSHHDDLIQSWDMAFKDTKDSDYVVGQVWMRRGVDAYLLEQVRGRWDFVETCRQFEQLTARWPQVFGKIVEDKANGPAVIAALRHKIGGIIPEEPQGSKEARASAISWLVEAGNVWLPAPNIAAWVGDLIEECAGFPTSVHDDQVDALTQALNRLVLQPFLAGEIVTAEDLDEELEDAFDYLPNY